jgi:hypothetical protein
LYIKQQIINYAKSKENSPDKNLKKLSKIIIKNINNFNCYYCLDSGKVWTERKSIFDKLDGRGSYDIKSCNHCSKGKWLHCTDKTNHISNGVKVFHQGSVTLNDIIGQLKILYKDKINQEPKWYLYQKDTIEKKTKEVDIKINLNDLATAVSASIQIYAGNIVGLVNTIKDLTINLGHTLVNENDSKELIKIFEQDGKKYFMLFKLEKQIKEKTAIGNLFKSIQFTFIAKYLLLSPENDCAIDICNDLMNDNIENKLDSFTF